MAQTLLYQYGPYNEEPPAPEWEERRGMIYRDPNPVYVGFWRRVLAYLMDALILTVVDWILPLPEFTQRLLDLLYFVILPATSWQGTIGKLAVGAKIVDGEGERISILRSLGRYFAQVLSGLLLFIGFIMIAFSAEKRGLHDWICNTFVLNRESELYP
ncbi:RDD family protein [Paenibacillus phocaensis]|uniref:RDD family protein n=1 Tax=Paenibacillus phocaensis TaxID=1776378 RepID=UPI000839D51A|nr:RDD family protein [Paenibacillus phocaensis]